MPTLMINMMSLMDESSYNLIASHICVQLGNMIRYGWFNGRLMAFV